MLRGFETDRRIPGLPTKRFWVTAQHDTGSPTPSWTYPPELFQWWWGSTSFRIPHNYSGMVSIDVVMYTTAISAAHRIRHQLDAALCGELRTTHTQTVDIDANFAANVYRCDDLVPVMLTIMPVLSPLDICYLHVQNRRPTHVFLLGADVRYI